MAEVPEAGGQPDALDELRARMEAIEKENSSLQEELDKLKKDSKKKPDPLSMSAKWNNGIEIASPDKKFKVHVGGRTQLDGIWIQNTSNLAGSGGALGDDAVDFRRARLRADGTMYEIIDWAAEFDFANSFNDNVGLQPASEANVSNVPAPTDLWVNFSKVPVFGNFRVGNMKEPIGMEHLESSRFLEFMERSFNQDVFTGAFNNGFTPGIMLWDLFDEKRGTWATGLYKNTANAFAFNTGDGEYAWTSRISYLLWFEDEGEKLLHVGVAGSIRQPDNNTARYRTRASLRNGPGALNPLMADTGNFHCTQEDFLAGEVAMNYGPFCFQAEYLGAWNQNSVGNFGAFAGVPLGTTFVHGGYAEVLLFLTGESRAYEHERGAFGRVKPKQNFEWKGCGCGAWQIGARVAHLDLDGDGLLGGKVDDATLGLNWFLNPNMKFQWNYVCTWRDSTRNGVDGTIHGFGMRLAQDF
jgi:phosphate-selective porin OprO/OprP